MSLERETHLTCPKCKKEGIFTLWDSVNVSLNPELKEKVLTRELFQWTCPHCGRTCHVDYPFVYHDMDKKLMLNFIPFEKGEKAPYEVEMEMPDMFKNMSYQFRMVYGIESLTEKILIWENGLDDTAIEILKQYIYETAQQDSKMSNRKVDFWFESKIKEDLYFAVLVDGELQKNRFAIPAKGHETMKGIIKDFKLFDPTLLEWQIVDADWALSALEKIGQ